MLLREHNDKAGGGVLVIQTAVDFSVLLSDSIAIICSLCRHNPWQWAKKGSQPLSSDLIRQTT